VTKNETTLSTNQIPTLPRNLTKHKRNKQLLYQRIKLSAKNLKISIWVKSRSAILEAKDYWMVKLKFR